MSVTEEELIRFVRTLDISAVERALCRGLSANTQTRKGNYNDITNMDSTKIHDNHGWLHQNNHAAPGIKMHLEIQSIGSLLHVLTSMYYEIRNSVFHKTLLDKYKNMFNVLLQYRADPNFQITHPYLNMTGFDGKNSVNVTGETPLHFAVKQLDIVGIEILLANGADPYLSHPKCKSVFEIVQDQNQSFKRYPYIADVNVDNYAIDSLKIYNMIMAWKKVDIEEEEE